MRERAIAAEATCALFISTAKKARLAKTLCDVEPRLFKHFEKVITRDLSRSKSKASASAQRKSRESLDSPTMVNRRTKSRGQRRRSHDAGDKARPMRASTAESLLPDERIELEKL